MIKAVIFDMDGVLTDSEVLKAESWKRILEEFGVKEGDKWYIKNMGNPGIELSKQATKEFNLLIDYKTFFKKNREIYLQILNKEGTIPIKEAINFLKSLPKEKLKIGLASSEYEKIIKQHLNSIKILHLFNAITSGADETEKGKPNPEIYLITAKKLGIKPKECIVIEDSSPGIEAAKRAGMKCIAYKNPNSGNQDLSKADFIVNSLLELDLNKIIN